MHHVKDGFHIDGVHFIESSFVDIQQGLIFMGHTRIVDNNVRNTKFFNTGSNSKVNIIR